jgi:protein-disulfide isomerase
LQFVFRNFPPIQIHPHAFNAAVAAETTVPQGKFWEIHDYLFEHQKMLNDNSLKNMQKILV